MRTSLSFLCIGLSLLLFFTLLGGVVQVGQAAQFPATTTYYAVTGEKCHDNLGFTESYPVDGWMRVDLNPITTSQVSYDVRCLVTNPASGVVLENYTEADTTNNRVMSDGNSTLYFITLPTAPTQSLFTFLESVDAYYMGERYVAINGEFIRSHYFLHVLTVPQNILRCEWFFEWDTGVLLSFVKSIEANFIRVQWVEYKVTNTTLSLTGAHPVLAFLTNFRDNFYAVIGGIILAIVLFYFLIQKKVERRVDA